MKSVKMFGKSVPILTIVVIALFAGVGVYAGLVTYLSNTVTTAATVESPVTFVLYDDLGVEITGPITAPLQGGESFDFIKIAHNDAENDVPFAIALVIKGDEVDAAVIVDSAGPVNDAAKTTIGTTQPWNDAVWHQNEGEAWYLHGAHEQARVDGYSYYGDLSTGTPFTNPLNTLYVDAVAVTLNGDEYYVVIFGGTIGDSIPNDSGSRDETDVVTNWGYGNPSGYTLRTVGHIPITVPADDGTTDPRGYDVGKVRVIFKSNYVGTVNIGMQLVVPGTTIEDVIGTVLGP